MAFIESSNLVDPPERTCPEKFGGLLKVFPPGVLEGHDRLGMRFRPNPCLDAIGYDPDVCVPGELKMVPGEYDAEEEVIIGMLQSAINCSYGSTIEEMRQEVRDALSNQLERSIESDLVAFLDANDVPQGGPLSALCSLAGAAQFLNNSSECGRGLIMLPVGAFVQLQNALVWNQSKGYHHDFVGNVVIPHSVDNSTVYALDMAIEVKISEVMILDEIHPGTTINNDKIVRGEVLYSLAIDSCVIGSWTLAACCSPC